jgi:hypothetical protein
VARCSRSGPEQAKARAIRSLCTGNKQPRASVRTPVTPCYKRS